MESPSFDVDVRKRGSFLMKTWSQTHEMLQNVGFASVLYYPKSFAPYVVFWSNQYEQLSVHATPPKIFRQS